MAPIGADPMENVPLLGMSCKAFSLLRKPAKIPTPPHTQVDAMPLWHSILFRDTRMNTYYCPAFIRKGINTIAQLRNMDIATHLPRTWIPVYQSSLSNLARPSTPRSVEDEGRPAFWLQWTKRTMLRFLMQLSPETPRQTPDTWRAWARLSLPPSDLVFIQTALWRKLTVGCRLANWQPAETACPLDRAQETMEHALTECRFLPTAFHLAVQCIGSIPHEGGMVVDPKEVLINTPVLSVTTPLGLVYWSAVKASWAVRCKHKFLQLTAPPFWSHFLRTWIKFLSEWEQHPSPSLPKNEITLLLHALRTMDATTVLKHPRVRVASDRPLPTLHQPARKKRKKFERAAELAAHYESIIHSHVEEAWSIVYPDGSSEKHPEVGRVGGYGVYFGDHRDVAEFLPVDELQTNIRGELRAALSALQGHVPVTRSLICPDCQLVVDGVLGLAQRWRRHKWRNTTGDVAHADLWAQILELTDRYGTEIKWIHIPSHIGIWRNEKADQLADLSRRKSPLLFGRISVAPRREDEEEERELFEGEASVWGYEEEPPPSEEDHSPTPCRTPQTPQATPQRLVGIPSPEIIDSPLWDVEVCTPAMVRKCRRIDTPQPRSQIKYTPQPLRLPLQSQPTPMSGVHHTPRVIGPSRCTFQTPEPPSPLTPSARTNLLRSLNLVEMEGGGGQKGHYRTAGWQRTPILSQWQTPTQRCPAAQRAQCASLPNTQQQTAC